MKTAFDIAERIEKIDDYTEAIKSGKAAISDWNEELGEGNVEVAYLTQLIDELVEEKKYLIQVLQEIKMNDDFHQMVYKHKFE